MDGRAAPTSMAQAETWACLRQGYPGAVRRVYLDTACKGIPPQVAIDAVMRFCAQTRECPGESATLETVSYMG